eukprot:gnl/TRDRNA2_/TRDRNA2_183159_c0_seq1.p1 gnl/TRDRNA2_/TRDRNA2_183159_c0~~gnl/TRDRNA2_/TRDRNA2_183159_c0_seq1.p1  ORF type:complete len:891 (+),score=192.93 gnl/TRDRNA2_/TRDRNA2_183159_c0_seq1:72-2675(+)
MADGADEIDVLRQATGQGADGGPGDIISEGGDDFQMDAPLPLGSPTKAPGGFLSTRKTAYLGMTKAKGRLSVLSMTAGAAIPDTSALEAVLDGSVSLVDLEADRLTEAIAWLYGSVAALQQSTADADMRMKALETQMPLIASRSVSRAMTPSVSMRSATPTAGLQRSTTPVVQKTAAEQAGPMLPVPAPANTLPQQQQEQQHEQQQQLPSLGAGVEAQLRHLEQRIGQLDHHQALQGQAHEKLIDMRIDSLKADVEHRLQSKDLEDLKVQLNEKLESAEERLKEDVAVISSTLANDSANDRRRLMGQFQVLNKRLTEQISLCEKSCNDAVQRSQDSMEDHTNRMMEIETTLSNLDIDKVEQKVKAFEATVAKLASGPWLRSIETFGKRLDALESGGGGIQSVSSEMMAAGADIQSRDLDPSQVVSRDLNFQESDDAVSEDSFSEVRRQLFEMHRTQSEVHHQLLEFKSKLRVLETQQKPSLSTAAVPSGQPLDDSQAIMEMVRAEIQEVQMNISDALRAGQQSEARIGRFEKEFQQTKSSQEEALAQFRRSIDTMVSYMSGSMPNVESDALAWLDKRIEGLLNKHKGRTLEARMCELERGAVAQANAAKRLEKVERSLLGVDLTAFERLAPDIQARQSRQEAVNEDLRRDTQELKVLVGCLEACVPRETRKAVQLFKRATAAPENKGPSSPRELEADAKLLALREEMESRAKSSEMQLLEQREALTQIMKGIERSQDMLFSKFEDLRDFVAPLSSAGTPQPMLAANADATARLPPSSANTNRSSDPSRGGQAPQSLPASKSSGARSEVTAGGALPARSPPPGWQLVTATGDSTAPASAASATAITEEPAAAAPAQAPADTGVVKTLG